MTLSVESRVRTVIVFFVFVLICCSALSLLGQEANSQQQLARFMALGSQALQKGDNAAAEQAFRQALAVDPDSIPVLNNLAISLARQQRETEAIALYEKALQLKPGDVVTRRNLGVAYFRARQYQAALPLLESSARETPSFQVLEIAGLDAFALDRYAVAARYLEAAHRAQPNDL